MKNIKRLEKKGSEVCLYLLLYVNILTPHETTLVSFITLVNTAVKTDTLCVSRLSSTVETGYKNIVGSRKNVLITGMFL